MKILMDVIYSTKHQKRMVITQLLFWVLIAQWFTETIIMTWDVIYIYYCFTMILFAPEILECIARRLPVIEFEFSDLGRGDSKWNDTIDWIETEHLIEFLLENDWLPTDKYRSEFWVNNVHLKKIWDNLERVGILKRGANNARVVAMDDEKIIYDVMKWVVDSDDLTPPLLQVSSWVYKLWLEEKTAMTTG